LRWKCWKERPLSEKLEIISSENLEIIDVLLSFLPEKVPNEAISSVQMLLSHPSYKIRTTAITVLSTQPSFISISDLLHCLTDDSPNVRMGGIYALNLCPNYWGELLQTISILINDENTDIRYNACQLAEKKKVNNSLSL
jgi:hypothetical protein